MTNRLRRTFSIRVMTASEVLGREADSDGPQNLAEAVIRASTRSSAEAPLAHVVLISDGSQIGLTPLAAAAARIGTPVSVLTFSDGADARDALIHSAIIPPFVYHRDRALVTANVRSFGMEGEAVVRLVEQHGTDEQEVTTTKIALKEDGTLTPARLEFEAARAELRRYVLRLDPMQDELTGDNNELHFQLDVRDDKLRVLFIDGNPSWEYRWLKHALDADPAVELFGLVRLPPDEWFFQGRKQRPNKRPMLSRAKDGFPASIDELSYFDVVILGDLERKLLERGDRLAVGACSRRRSTAPGTGRWPARQRPTPIDDSGGWLYAGWAAICGWCAETR